MDKDILKKFNLEDFINASELLNKNLKGLHCNVAINEKEDNQIGFKIENCPPQYKKALFSLAKDVAEKTMAYACIVLNPEWALCEDDYSNEIKFIGNYINEHKPMFLDLSINQGLNPLIDELLCSRQRFCLAYKLKNLQRKKNEYFFGEERYDKKKGCFIKPDNSLDFEDSVTFQDILGCNC